MHPLADATTCAEGKEVSNFRVRVRGRLDETVWVIFVPIWFETAGVGVASWVRADRPDVVNDGGALGDVVALRMYK